MDKKYLRILSYFLVAALSVGMTLGITTQINRKNTSKLDILENLIQARFIGESDKTTMEDAAAAAMVQSLGDRWSYYIPASNIARYSESVNNSYVGIGVTIRPAEDGTGLVVEAVVSGGPAEKAGFLVGDIIVAIEDTSAEGLSAAEARNIIQGKEGTSVSITVLRQGEAITLYPTRGTILSEVASGIMLTEEVGLVTIRNFETRCAKETIAAIQDLMDQGAKALLFDVRNNPGGASDELTAVLDYLLPEGRIFHTMDYTGKQEHTMSDADCIRLPMAVLVNERSYSAAEYFAVALQEYDAAKIVGMKTCGKGYFQVVYNLKDGSAVGLSIGKYFTPKGENLAGVGVTPDFEVPVDDEVAVAIYNGTIDRQEDPQLQRALEYLLEVRYKKNT